LGFLQWNQYIEKIIGQCRAKPSFRSADGGQEADGLNPVPPAMIFIIYK
jgi:hypothetical protein